MPNNHLAERIKARRTALKTNDWHVTVTPIEHPCGDALWWKATVIAPWGATICEAPPGMTAPKQRHSQTIS